MILNYFVGGDWKWYLFHPLKFIKYLYREICAIIERGLTGCASSDSWNFDHYVSVICVKGLNILKKSPVGFSWDKENNKEFAWNESFKKRDEGESGFKNRLAMREVVS